MDTTIKQRTNHCGDMISMFTNHEFVDQSKKYTHGMMARIKQINLAFIRRRKMNRAIAHLNQMDDRMLADIGISQNEIEWVVRTGLSVSDRPDTSRYQPRSSVSRAGGQADFPA